MVAQVKYRVGAENSVGSSAHSPDYGESELMATDPAPPAKPAAPAAQTLGSNSIVVEWVAPDDFNTPITSYTLEMKGPGAQVIHP